MAAVSVDSQYKAHDKLLRDSHSLVECTLQSACPCEVSAPPIQRTPCRKRCKLIPSQHTTRRSQHPASSSADLRSRSLRRFPGYLLACLLVCYPAVMLNVQGSANGILFTVALCGLFTLPALSGRTSTANTTNDAAFPWLTPRLIALLALTPLLATCANELSRMHWLAKNLDLPLRFALLGPCIAGCLLVPRSHLRHMQWGFIGGAIISFARLAYLNRDGVRATQIGFLNTIPFSDISLLLGFLSLLTLGWSLTGQRWESILKIIGFAAGLLGSFISQSRGGWLAIPFLAILCWLALRERHRAASTPDRRAIIAVTTLAVLAIAVRLAWSRMAAAVADVHNFANGHPDTPVGMRFEVWRAAGMMFRGHPVFGVGSDQFHPALASFVDAGAIPAATLPLRHAHNEFLYALSTLGLVGGLALLCVYLAPMGYFLRSLRSPVRETRAIAAMGASISIAYLLFGLTETLFVISMNTAIYVVLTGAMIAFLQQRQSSERAAVSQAEHRA